MSSTVHNSPLGDKTGNGGREYVAVPAGFVQPDTTITVADAVEYVADALVGFDVLLLEVRQRLLGDLPDDMAAENREKITTAIDRRIDAARDAVDEYGPNEPG